MSEGKDSGIEIKSFHGDQGGSEHYICVAVPPGGDFKSQLTSLQERYDHALKSLDLGPGSAIFRRVFLSDIMNQAAVVRESSLAAPPQDDPVAVSIVQQPPLSGAKIALLAYHVQSPSGMKKRRLSMKHMVVEKQGRRHLWSTRMCSGAADVPSAATHQTAEVFNDLLGALSQQDASLRDNCIRTWIYVKGIDAFYQQVVDRRIEIFDRQGLTRDSHYIASTGIEGACAHQFDLVSMDAYSVLDLEEGQVSYLNDFEQLCATKDYKVTFERGTRVAYADRAHHFISGTASIDCDGWVVHPGDVLAQLKRALVNVDALLKSGAASLGDMMYLIVYLRDPTDFHCVDAYFKTHLPDLPMVIVQGAVCRPEWLIEVEGVAIAANHETALPSF